MTGTPAAAPAFELHDIGYVYNRRQAALNGVDLTIGLGERVAILGANGCGKSTLLKILDGLLAPTSGSMSVFGEDVSTLEFAEDAHRFHRRVGLVFQDPDVQLFSPTVGDDVAFGPLQLGLPLPEVRARVESALEFMGISHLRDRAPFELSGGEKKRAAIATVMCLDPDVILFDEPTASLDPRTKWVLINSIGEMGAAGKTTVVATHDLEIVPLIADRAIVLGEDRRVLADGPAEGILEDWPTLVRANLIHEHLHRHATIVHSHPHGAAHHGPGHPDGVDSVEGS